MWWLTSPTQGSRPFFSLGVNVVDQGLSASDLTPANPSYSAWRLYKSPADWAHATLRRLRAWGFNTIGGWSDDRVLQPAPTSAASTRSRARTGADVGTMAVTPVLDAGRAVGVPWTDLFADSFSAQLDEAIRTRVVPWHGREDVLGFFIDNELGWWSDSLFAFTLRQPETSRTRARLLQHLRDRYANDFDRLRRDFDTDVDSFDALARGGTLRVADAGEAPLVIDEFLGLVAERYYALAAASLRRHAPTALVLGDRYVGSYDWPVVRAAGAHVDVISTNQGADWLTGDVSRFFLETLHRLSGKPVLVSEFYFSATENRSGNRNSGQLFPTVATQAQRAASARRQLERLASLPFVVGAHWFQYYDEPTFGRPADGEDYNMGLVDIHDRPYEALTAAFSTLDVQARHARARHLFAETAGTSSGTVGIGVGAVAAPPVAAGTPLESWPLDRAFVGPTTVDPRAGAFGDAYVSWHPEGLAVAVYALGFADPVMYGPVDVDAPSPTPITPTATTTTTATTATTTTKATRVQAPPVSQLVATLAVGPIGSNSANDANSAASANFADSSPAPKNRAIGVDPIAIPFGPDGAVSPAAVPPWARTSCVRTRCQLVAIVPAARLGHDRLSAGLSIPVEVTLRYRMRTMRWRHTVRLARP